MEADHSVVWGDAELGGHMTDSHAIDNDATQDLRMLGLQVVHLNKHAPAVEYRAVFDRRKLELVDRMHELPLPAQLVHHQVTHQTSKPRFDPPRVANLMGPFEGALERRLQHVLRIESAGTFVAHHS
jgi:hypothetical protein